MMCSDPVGIWCHIHASQNICDETMSADQGLNKASTYMSSMRSVSCLLCRKFVCIGINAQSILYQAKIEGKLI